MIERIRHIIRDKVLSGIHLYFTRDGDYRINMVIVRNKGKIIKLEKVYEDLGTFEEIGKYNNGIQNVKLVLDGKGIIHKKMKLTDHVSPVRNVLPNANEDDFHVQLCEISNNDFFISVARKDVISEITKKFKQLGIYISDVKLGPFVVNSLAGLFKNEPADIVARYYQLHVQNYRITDISYIPDYIPGKMVDISGDLLPVSCLEAYAHVIQNLSNEQVCELVIPAIEKNKTELLFKKLFKTTGWIALSFLFGFLLVNFLLFDRYNKKNNQLGFQLQKNEVILKKLESRKAELLKKEDLVKKSGLESNIYTSYLADRIAYTLPYSILLTEMDIFPVKNKIKPKERIEIHTGIIKVSGKTKYSTILNNWINELENENWVKNVEIVSFYQESRDSYGEFEIEVKLNK